MPPAYEPLSTLGPGETATVVSIAPAIHGVERRRLLDLGLVPGTRVGMVRRGPGGDLAAYRIRGAVMALRDEQATHVRIERAEPKGEVA